jgi:hypothetical protein
MTEYPKDETPNEKFGTVISAQEPWCRGFSRSIEADIEIVLQDVHNALVATTVKGAVMLHNDVKQVLPLHDQGQFLI